MKRHPASEFRKGAGMLNNRRRGVFALTPVLIFASYAAAQPAVNARSEAILPQCRTIPLNIGSKSKSNEDKSTLGRVLGDFETAFLVGNADLFAEVVSPALLKKPEDSKKIFEGTLLEYDLRRVRLQRNWIWELDLGERAEPGRTASCGDIQIQPVYGPTKQFAVQYSAFTGANQTKIFALFARSESQERAAEKTEKIPIGLVHLQVQRWTYDGRTPERLFTEAQKTASSGDLVGGHLLAEASARVLEINPYIIYPLLGQARTFASRMNKESAEQLTRLLRRGQTDSDWNPEKLVPVFRDGSLAMGLKIRMNKEIALNEQTRRCKQSAVQIFSSELQLKSLFAGIECMTYGAGEDLAKPPRGGSQFFQWSTLKL